MIPGGWRRMNQCSAGYDVETPSGVIRDVSQSIAMPSMRSIMLASVKSGGGWGATGNDILVEGIFATSITAHPFP